MNERQIKDLKNLEDRASNLYQRVVGFKTGAPGFFDSTLPRSSDQPIQITTTQFELYDENWREAVRQLQANNKKKSYEELVNHFNEQIEMKAEVTDLSEKADRQYVDYLLREISFASKKLLDEKLNTEFSGIQGQLDQTRADLTTMKFHFNAQIDSIKKELAYFKRTITDPSLEEDETVLVVQERHPNHHPKQLPALPTTNFGIPTIQKPKIYRDPYKRRSRPYAPQGLDETIHRDVVIPESDE